MVTREEEFGGLGERGEGIKKWWFHNSHGGKCSVGSVVNSLVITVLVSDG